MHAMLKALPETARLHPECTNGDDHDAYTAPEASCDESPRNTPF
jgi:hypothetical protein